MTENQPPADTDEGVALAAELREVTACLQDALEELYAPLGDLARANLRATEPPVRALAVLATGVRPDEEPQLRARRIVLAAALEMLAVALRIHNLLLNAGAAANGSANAHHDPQELDRSIAGSTILTGDYCFSRAAVLAAQTDSPTVVDIFSQTLKNVSEGRLRASFDPFGPPFIDDIELVRAGVQGAAHLAALSAAQVESALGPAAALATGASVTAALAEAPNLTAQQRRRWQAAWHTLEAWGEPTAPGERSR